LFLFLLDCGTLIPKVSIGTETSPDANLAAARSGGRKASGGCRGPTLPQGLVCAKVLFLAADGFTGTVDVLA
jgi:hypothetical protein